MPLSSFKEVKLNTWSSSGRRSFVTTISARGDLVRLLMRALGHRQLSSTMEYVDASDLMLQNAVELAWANDIKL